MPLVSILLPVFNAEADIADTLESLVSQTHHDLEIIVVNDGSTDGTLPIIQKFCSRDHRIKVISKENGGIVSALNLAIGHHSGRYIARMDAADISHPRRIEMQVAYLRSRPKVVCLGTNCVLIDNSGKYIRRTYAFPGHKQLITRFLSGNPFYHPTVMIDTKLAGAEMIYKSEWDLVEDLDLWMRLSECGELALLTKPLLKCRLTDGGITKTKRDSMLLRHAERKSLFFQQIDRSEVLSQYEDIIRRARDGSAFASAIKFTKDVMSPGAGKLRQWASLPALFRDFAAQYRVS